MQREQNSCVICFQSSNNNSDSKNFAALSIKDSKSKSYLEKIQSLTNIECVFDYFLICFKCIQELDDAYNFREKVIKSLTYCKDILHTENESDEQNGKAGFPQNDLLALAIENLKNEDYCEIGSPKIDNLEELCKMENIQEFCKMENIQEFCNMENIQEFCKMENIEEFCKIENSEETESFSCSKCKHIFMTASELLNHNCFESINRKQKKIEKKFNVSNGKENHVFSCQICDKSFDKNWQLNRHVKVFHLNVKNYICNYCNKGFKQLYHLQEHITSHTGERKFKCNICSKTFSRVSSQRKHMKAHEAAPGEKSKKSPFLCSICGKKFPYSNGAQRHMRTHSDDRRYECNICGNKFSQTSHLRVHLRTHTGEKPYPCKLCTESFSLNANLRKHMKNHKQPENVNIFHNLEPNLSQKIADCDFEDSETDFIEREIPFSFADGGF